MPSHLVSIIMPAYNAEKSIAESIESVLDQTYKNFELIVVNDCSSDNTKKIVKNFIQLDSRIKFIDKTVNEGVASARNTGLDHALGDFIAFLDSDDKWKENKLEKQLDIFNKYAGIDVIYSSYYRFNSSGISKVVGAPNFLNKKQLLKGNPIGNLTAIYNFKKFPAIRQKKIGHEDYLFWLELFSSSNNVKGFGIQEPLAYYRVAENGASLSGNKLRSALWTWNIYRHHLKLNVISSMFYFAFYVFKAVFKRV
ncbi:glycosyltransferase family 2 protein [Acinetobacter sp. ANC5681]|uniref:glycosyltransferase family 2 protein n=1 Tax=Acinetobacter sp. ANC5681 TaxID=2929504 RepID=UPI00201B1D62|nr:glycosyltransferase family 2 protein [Acinetobacter sp. ANC5681]MCL5768343.1 glycosyltransferase family 2 protein [Acinetobacter sp. ANC5681]